MVAILAVTLMASPALAANGGGGKKKARKKAKVECKQDKVCDSRDCDPRCCDPVNCNLKNCKYTDACPKKETCTDATSCAGAQ